MIRSFASRETRNLYEVKRSRKFAAFVEQAERRLQVLDNAVSLSDLAGLPSNRLEALSGDRKGQFSIRVNRQWRVCFRWGEDGPFDVEIVDYH